MRRGTGRAIRHGLNKSQIRALQKLKEASSEEYQKVTGNGHVASNSVEEAENKNISRIDLNDLSCREINGIVSLDSQREFLYSPSHKKQRLSAPRKLGASYGVKVSIG